jgi:hypothetical protein
MSTSWLVTKAAASNGAGRLSRIDFEENHLALRLLLPNEIPCGRRVERKRSNGFAHRRV